MNLQHVLAVFIIVGLPIWDVYETRRLKASSNPRRKILAYQRIMAVEWVGALVALTAVRSRIFSLGSSVHQSAVQQKIGVVLVWGGVGAAAVILTLQILLIRRNLKLREKTLEAFRRLSFVLPVTPEERAWFALVSLTAGICEEILYRGFLMRYLANLPWHLELWMALVVSSLAFGLAHSYQGVAGIAGTAAVGGVLALIFVVLGSLWLPMVLHAAVDLRVLLLLRPGDLVAFSPPGATS